MWIAAQKMGLCHFERARLALLYFDRTGSDSGALVRALDPREAVAQIPENRPVAKWWERSPKYRAI